MQILTLVVAVFMNPALNADGYVYYRTETQSKLSVLFNLLMSLGTLLVAIPQVAKLGFRQFIKNSQNTLMLVYIILTVWLTLNFIMHGACRDEIPDTRKVRIEKYKHKESSRMGYEPFDHQCAMLE